MKRTNEPPTEFLSLARLQKLRDEVQSSIERTRAGLERIEALILLCQRRTQALAEGGLKGDERWESRN